MNHNSSITNGVTNGATPTIANTYGPPSEDPTETSTAASMPAMNLNLSSSSSSSAVSNNSCQWTNSASAVNRVHGWMPPNTQLNSSDNARLLKLVIYSGHNLAKKDIFGASDPYVRIDLLKNDRTVIDSVYTKTKKKTLNPVWNEEFLFRVSPSNHYILVEVFDENRLTRDDFLGRVEFPLTDVKTASPDAQEVAQRHSVTLQQRSSKSKVRGHLEIYIALLANDDNHTDDRNLLGEGDWEIVPSVPDTLAADIPQSTSNEDLPSGWEELQDTNGRTYFVNHNSRSTQWHRPESINGLETLPRSSNESNNRRQVSDGQRNSSFDSSVPPDERVDDADSSSGSSQNSSPQHGESGATTSGAPNSTQEAAQEEPPSFSQRNASSSSSSSSSATSPDSTEVNSPTIAPTTVNSVAALPDSSAALNEQENGALLTPRTAPSPPSRRHHNHHHRHRHHHRHQEGEASSPNAIVSTSTNGFGAQKSLIEDPDLGPLPTNWSKQTAQNGRVFFIDHNTKTTTWVDPRTGKASSPPAQQSKSTKEVIKQSQNTPVDDLGSLPEGWEERVHKDGRIFFINHNTRTTQWEDPRMDNPSICGPPIAYSRDYKQKYEYFMRLLPKPLNAPNKFEIKISRQNILEDSFRIISNVAKVDYLKTKLWVEFDNEEVLDYGGPGREWFYLLSKEMFNPYYGLFEYSSTDKYTLQIRPHSGLFNESHLAYFKFIGRVAGMAIYHGKLLDAFFIRPFYKMMLGKDINLNDMESVDAEYYNSLKYILENDPKELELTFSVDERDQVLDQVEERELKPGGSSIEVTNDNKNEYINLVIDWRFVSRVKKQMDSFLDGFHELIPRKSIEIFDENELELLMCGIGNVDVKDWKHNTVYKGGYMPNHIVIQWFWRVVLSFNNEMRARLLQFVTGTSRVPMNGFKELYGSNGPQLFTIEKWGAPQNLPRSHTCFNRIDLPHYESYSDLREKLIKAIEGSESYGGVD